MLETIGRKALAQIIFSIAAGLFLAHVGGRAFDAAWAKWRDSHLTHARAARVVEFEGRKIVVPEGYSDAEIAKFLSGLTAK